MGTVTNSEQHNKSGRPSGALPVVIARVQRDNGTHHGSNESKLLVNKPHNNEEVTKKPPSRLVHAGGGLMTNKNVRTFIRSSHPRGLRDQYSAQVPWSVSPTCEPPGPLASLPTVPNLDIDNVLDPGSGDFCRVARDSGEKFPTKTEPFLYPSLPKLPPSRPPHPTWSPFPVEFLVITPPAIHYLCHPPLVYTSSIHAPTTSMVAQGLSISPSLHPLNAPSGPLYAVLPVLIQTNPPKGKRNCDISHW